MLSCLTNFEDSSLLYLSNQRISFVMGIDNPALTGQILSSCARAVTKQAPGCYTLIEIPPINLLEGDIETLIHDLV